MFQENIGLVIFGKIPHGLKPCELKKGIILSCKFYFLIAQAFPFLEENIVLKILLGFKKTPQMFSSPGFHKSKKSVSFNWVKKTEPLWVWLGAFEFGILGLHCTLH